MDVVVVLAFLLLWGGLLVPFRPYPLPNGLWSLSLLGSMLVALVAWHRRSTTLQLLCTTGNVVEGFVLRTIPGLLLLTSTIYVPLSLIHFDTGTDLTVAFGIDSLWFKPWAEFINRPLASVGPLLAMKLSSQSLNGFLIVNTLCRLITALLIVALLRMLSKPSIAFLAGLFFVVNHGELAHFNLWSIYYNTAVTTLLLAMAMWVYSYLTGSRLLLGGACVVLGIAFLQYEHGYGIAAALPLLLVSRGFQPRLLPWLLAWYGTITILFLRLITLIKFHASYHLSLYTWAEWPHGPWEWVRMIGRNLLIQMEPISNLGIHIKYIGDHVLVSMLAFCLTMLVVMVTLRSTTINYRSTDACVRGEEFSWVAYGALLTLLGIVVFLPLPITESVPDYGQNPTMRYQFFAEIGHAVFWAALVCFFVSYIKLASRERLALAVTTGILTAGAISESLDYQLKGGVLNPYFNYDDSAATWRSIKKLLPKLDNGDLIFLELPDSRSSPIGWNYTGLHFSCRFFGVPMNQGRIDSEGNRTTRVFSYSDALHLPTSICPVTHHFRLSSTGEVVFVNTIRSQTALANIDACKAMCSLTPSLGAPEAPLPFLQFDLP